MSSSRILYKTIPFASDFFNLVKPVLAKPGTVLLDSGRGFGDLGRYSVFAENPYAVFSTRQHLCSFCEGRDSRRYEHDPLDALKTVMRKYRLDREESPLPFIGGALGFFGYDLGRTIEKLPDRTAKPDEFPDIHLGFYDSVLVHDNREKRLFLCVSDPLNQGANALQEKLAGLERIVDKLLSQHASDLNEEIVPVEALSLSSNFTLESYCGIVETALEHIRNGDIYQVNLSQAFEFGLNGNALALYSCLRRCSPAPFAAFMELGMRSVVSSSPERFLSLRGKTIEARPIKGTRPRGRTAEDDNRLRTELMESPKDRAELTMIVDLLRNDIGRVARFNTVCQKGEPVIEEYASVFHRTATVEGELREGCDAVDLIRASFPGGSITGAPKIRAMEIIEELEPTKRSLYTGSLGYLGFDGDMDLNILIRTILVEGEKGRFQVGGGIVADSKPLDEYQETLHKAQGIFKSLGTTEEAAYG